MWSDKEVKPSKTVDVNIDVKWMNQDRLDAFHALHPLIRSRYIDVLERDINNQYNLI